MSSETFLIIGTIVVILYGIWGVYITFLSSKCNRNFMKGYTFKPTECKETINSINNNGLLKRIADLEILVKDTLSELNFPLEVITKHQAVIAGGFIRCLDLQVPYKDIDVFVPETQLKNIINVFANSGYVLTDDTGAVNNIYKFTRDNVIVDLTLLRAEDTRRNTCIYELMDLTHSMITFGELGSPTISASPKYFDSIFTKKIYYNETALWQPNGTLKRIDKFEKAGWNTIKAYTYVSDRLLRECKQKKTIMIGLVVNYKNL